MSEFHPLTIRNIRKTTADAVCLTFAVPDELTDTFRYIQGQYLTLQAEIDGEDVRRAYSICSAVGEPQLQVGIRKVAGGRFSSFANEHLAAGDTLQVMAPQGTFYTAINEEHAKNYLLIAAGSGITPILSIIKTVLTWEPASHLTLLYGNRKTSTIMFREELEQLKNRYMSRFQMLHILGEEERDVDILNGRINNRKGGELCRHVLQLDTIDEFFLCGPEPMISEVSRGLRAEGISEDKIHYELFTASAADAKTVLARHHERAVKMAGKIAEVTIVADGRHSKFALSADGENILDGGLDNGVDLPFACKGGVCATCKAKLIEGEVDMDLNHALEDDELEAGYILTCQAHPVSDKVVVDFDQ